MTTTTELDELLAFAATLADASRAILGPAGRRRPDVEIKRDASLVTEHDKAIEQRLRELITARYPAHGVLGEEFGGVSADASHVWVLDPIDGTGPFVGGMPVYGTLIGLARDGLPLLGAIDHPRTDDRWLGGPGLGSTWNGEPVHTRACPSLAGAMLTSSSPDFFEEHEWARFRRLRERVQWALYGGSCYAYGLMAGGRTDIGVDCKLDVHDIFACAAVIQGAGGLVTDWQGGVIDLGWQGQVLAAGDPAAHAAAMQVLAGD